MIALDIRSLITFRICFGLYILFDIWYTRLPIYMNIPFIDTIDYNIPWYTSSSSTTSLTSSSSIEETTSTSLSNTLSYLQSYDTPHKSIIHQIWFYRGSKYIQYILFIITSIFAILYTFGIFEYTSIPLHQNSDKTKTTSTMVHILYSTKSILFKLCFYCLISSYQNRNMYVHDGSDTYTRLLLLYTSFIPLSLPTKISKTSSTTTSSSTVKKSTLQTVQQSVTTLSTFSISIQIVCMYLGTICHRTIDLYYKTNTTTTITQNEWLPPTLSAVYNAICFNTFAVRYYNIMNYSICSNYTITQIMTLCAIIIETFSPIIGFGILLLLYHKQYLHHPLHYNTIYLQRILWYGSIVPLLLLHFGLLCSLRLPNWQFIASIALLLWIPTYIWDTIENIWYKIFKGKLNKKQKILSYKKTDGDIVDIEKSLIQKKTSGTKSNIIIASKSSSKIITLIEYFLLFYMIYNFFTERSILYKYDSGDIGELFRISQYWVMFSTVGTTSHTTHITGTIHISDTNSFINDTIITNKMDILQFISNGKIELPQPIMINNINTLSNVSYVSTLPYMITYYPTVRWERALHTWAQDSFKLNSNVQQQKQKQQQLQQRIHYFGNTLCQLINQEFNRTIVQQQQQLDQQITSGLWNLVPFQQYQRQRNIINWLNNSTTVKDATVNDSTISHNQYKKLIYLTEIEIRFQHIQVLEKRSLHKISSDTVFIVPCYNHY